MKLLFDQNLSPALVERLADVFPQSIHVRDAGLASAPDEAVWRFALEQGLAIVTKDSDFQERSQIAETARSDIGIFGLSGLTVTTCRAGCTTKSMSSIGIAPSNT